MARKIKRIVQGKKLPRTRKYKAFPSNYHDELPRAVKLGYANFLLEKRSNQFCEKEDMFGDCDVKVSRIRFNVAQSPNELANTIIHEILHALFHTEGIKVPDSVEERVVNNLANGICKLIKDNPDLMHGWLKKALK